MIIFFHEKLSVSIHDPGLGSDQTEVVSALTASRHHSIDLHAIKLETFHRSGIGAPVLVKIRAL